MEVVVSARVETYAIGRVCVCSVCCGVCMVSRVVRMAAAVFVSVLRVVHVFLMSSVVRCGVMVLSVVMMAAVAVAVFVWRVRCAIRGSVRSVRCGARVSSVVTMAVAVVAVTVLRMVFVLMRILTV